MIERQVWQSWCADVDERAEAVPVKPPGPDVSDGVVITG